MLSYKNFFVKCKLLTSDQYDLLIKNCVINIEKNNSTNKIDITIGFDDIPDPELVFLIEKNNTNNEITSDHVKINYQIRDIINNNANLSKYINEFINQNSLSSNQIITSSLNTFEIEGNKLIIFYNFDAQKPIINQWLNKLFNFLFKFGIDFTGIELRYREDSKMKEKIKQMYDEEIKKANVEIVPVVDLIETYNKMNKVDNKIDTIKSLEKITNFEKTNMISLQGEVFHITKPEKAGAWDFYIKDETGCLCCRAWPSKEGEKTATGWAIPNNKPEAFLGAIKVGDWIKVKGKYDYKKGTTIPMYTIYSLYIDKNKKKVNKYDTAEKPRIEVLCHTKFSSFDGLNSASELVDYSINSKMPAIGFCDRDNTQGFPNIDTASSKKKQEAMYGYEVSVLDRNTKACINGDDNSGNLVDQEYVIFDIETTGLINELDEIIEFGAIKAKNGIIIERIDLLLKPNKLIPQHISDLTHITNQMLSDKKTFAEEAQRIVEWIGDAVLVAHNGINFDIRFINKKLAELNMKPLANTLIDTMQVSRSINPQYIKHRLSYICRQNKIAYDESVAHRADFDAEVLYHIWKIFINNLTDKGITKISELNKSLINNDVFKQMFPQYMNIYARNKVGLKKLYELVSLSLTTQFFSERPTLFREQIQSSRVNLIVCNNPYEGSLWDIACNGSDEELKEEIGFYDYVLIAPRHCLKHEIDKGIITNDGIEKIIRRIVKFANELNKKIIATANVYYLYNSMSDSHSVLIHNKLIGGKFHRFLVRDKIDATPPLFYFMTTEEMKNEFSFINDRKLINEIVVDNTYDFKDKFEHNNILIKGLFTPKIDGVDQKLSELVETTLKQHYGDKIDPVIRERIDKELSIIIGKGYAVIYWISHLLVKKSNESGYVVGSRGSVGSSFIAFLAKISDVNALPPHYICNKCKHHEFYDDKSIDGYDLPLKKCPECGEMMRSDGHNIPFESFLGTLGAPKVPDIDLNFSGEYQDKARDFINGMFGSTNAFRAGTVMTIAEKTAFGFVKKYFEETNLEKTQNVAEILYLQKDIVDGKRTNGLHAGGTIVVPSDYDIHDFCPYSLQPNTDGNDESNNEFATHFDFHAIHDNLLKFDILGHDIPTIFKLLRDTSGVDTTMVNFQDHKVLELFDNLKPLGITPDDLNGETIGTYALPECATNFTIGMIKESKPRSFGDLIRISGLSHGTDVWLGNAKNLILKDGKKLKDVVSFREDMLEFLASNGVSADDSFKFAELVRKGNQKNKANEYNALCDILRQNNVPEWYIDSCTKIRYLFPKAHATSYMTHAYICGWYKIYYPLDFYAAWFSAKPTEYDLGVIAKDKKTIIDKINDVEKRLASKELKASVTKKEEDLLDVYKVAIEAISRGIKIGMIDLEKSHASHFVIDRENNTIIAPFKAIAGLGDAVASSIINERNIKPFDSKEDLMARTKINKNHFAQLVQFGVLDKLSDSAQMSLSDFFN